ncbi:hypothetical protein ACHQM5_008951 [Ranunculus cassubicifolius]
MAEFPEEVTVEILARLPVKSVSRFKTVCKPWNNLISNPYFARKQLKHGSKLKILFRGSDIFESKFYSADYDKPDEQVMLNLPSSYVGWSYNSCDGLFVLSDVGEEDLVCIWNPSTGERYNLPVPFPEDSSCNKFNVKYGIGFDPTTEVYKVLRIEYCRCHMPDKNQIFLYTLNSNSWRRLNTIPYKPRIGVASKMVLVDNNLHFFGTWTNSEVRPNSKLILSFDLSNEVFKEILLPNNGEGFMDIIQSSSRLCVAFYMSNPRRTDVWVMKEYGIQESWTKSFSINEEIYNEGRPLYLSENAEILFCGCRREASKYWTFCDSSICKVKSVEPDRKLGMWRTEIYTESLISTKILLQREKVM